MVTTFGAGPSADAPIWRSLLCVGCAPQAGILFSRKVAKVISVESPPGYAMNTFTYTVRGQLFFVSAVYFLGWLQSASGSPPCITIDMAEARIWDQNCHTRPRIM